ncbi:hypothetical protein P0W64_17520 [Tsukamurella sp. 8F]|uniref:DUF7373 family lipoprotein n=1 Tax=unclassified Tsukamurella TaxID=2633480 RepID=UPI0023B9C9D8|nr:MULTISPECIES: hypothetical protein [unclassified Tsukamurella]MDF0530267.1 hypothetical protein [Tsukamurella sp. 8J]MDF0588585.1 hypothetical protein [Tsukamurella sp. 8F]
MRRSLGLPALILSVAAATALAACSTETAGTATGSSGHKSGSTASIPAGLDTGSYPTTPRAIPAFSSDQAWVAEGNRMGDALIQVNEIDSRMTLGGAGLRSFPVLSGIQLSSRVPDDTSLVFEANGMKVGMTTTRGDSMDSPTVATRIGLYRFPTDAAAQKAVTQIRAKVSGKEQVSISSAPGAVATEFKPGTVDSYLAQGPIVVNVSGTGPTTSDAAGFVTKAYQLEIPRLKSFTPTPVAEVTKLPSDRDGIMSRILGLKQSSSTSVGTELATGYLSQTGLFHRIKDISKKGIYVTAGVDLVGQSDGVVYRTRDAGAAKQFLTDLYAIGDKKPADAAPGVPGMKCVRDYDATLLRCGVAVGRYVADLTASSIGDARQKASAEYALLTEAG